MHTKYHVPFENTYLGPILPIADSFFEEMLITSIPIDRSSTYCNTNDQNNNPDYPVVFRSQNYECRLKSSTKGEIRLFAGHHKHAFTTCNRPITCKVSKGQMKVKCGSQKWTVMENNNIKLNPNSKYFVKNNSVRNECTILFTFEEQYL